VARLKEAVDHPAHYNAHPSGVECIQIVEWMNFNLGNAVKFIWRSGEKAATIEDLQKARWYLDREIARLRKLAPDSLPNPRASADDARKPLASNAE